MLGPVLHYNYSLSPTQLRRSHAHAGTPYRLRRVIRDLFTGQRPIHIGVIGTSVSWGTGASVRGKTDWFTQVEQVLRVFFPRANISAYNGCFPATASSFANMCLDKMVRPEVDLLFIEYVTNDFPDPNIFGNVKMMAYERLLRKVLQYKNHPAVVLTQVITWGQSFKANSTHKKWFHESAEDQYGVLAQYYGLPWLSYRNAIWIDAEYKRQAVPGGWKALTNDEVHPNDAGHRVILDTIIWLVQQTSLDLLMQPFSKIDHFYIKQELPPPMHPTNYEERIQMCLLEDELLEVVDRSSSEGWEYINEGTAEKKKFGMIGTRPGTHLTLQLNMAQLIGVSGLEALDKVPQSKREISVMITYLKSYTNMGVARIECKAGCTCKPNEVDAHHDQRTSTSYMVLTEVMALADTCVMTVTITSKTNSGAHKFKVSSIMMNHKAVLGFGWGGKPAEWYAERMFSGELQKELV